MHGLMMDMPLLISGLIQHADRHHGATEIVSKTVEGAIHRYTYREAHARARRNYELNGHDPARHEFAALDVNRYLQTAIHEGRHFDLVVIDPPAFAKNLAQKERALRGYESLNTLAARVVSPGGLLLTCSCSGAVTMDEFEAVVRQGLLRARRTAQLIASFGPSLDHPTLPGFPEDRYLKALVFRLLART